MERLNLLGAQEWTVECNPATVSLDKARLLRSYGVNRVSMGVQSLDETLLDRLGRVHTREMVFTSFDVLRQAGFQNVNLDLMFAIPGQTLAVWRETLDEAIGMGSEHLSSYEVIYEEDTALYAQLRAGEFEEDENLACDMYDQLVERATQAGFHQYEVANFARGACVESRADGLTRREDRLPFAQVEGSKLNVESWRFDVRRSDAVGAQTLAVSPPGVEVRGVRTKNFSNTQLYCEQLERGKRPIESREELPPLARAGETAAFGLRMVTGWRFGEFHQITGHDLRQEWASDMAHLTAQGWARVTPDQFQLTFQGLRFADAAAQLFLRP
jgi:oxygen-independent coproporphyrinogen-3 oxidase